MLSNCSGKHHTTHASEETFKIMINDYCLIVGVAADKQMRFHPTGKIWVCRHDSSTHSRGVTVIESESCRHFNDIFNPHATMSDCSDAMLRAGTTALQDSVHGQCYWCILASVKKNWTKCFNSEASESPILKDLKSTQAIGFTSMSDIAYNKLKRKHPTKSHFLHSLKSHDGMKSESISWVLT